MANKSKNISSKKTLKVENKSLKKLPKFQKSLKSKFKDNVSVTRITEKKDKIRLQKIKIALQKSKIKNKTAILKLNKVVYKNKELTDIVNSSFSELIKSPEKFTILKFFETYNNLFYDIPKKGEKSHESLINQSREYIDNYADSRDTTIEDLIELLEKKDEELNQKQNPITNEHLFYPDGTLLRTHAFNTEYVENIPQGLPIWIMQQGMKREFKSYDVYAVIKKILGFEKRGLKELGDGKFEVIGDKDADITELLHTTDLNYIPTGRDINDDSDLNIPPGPDREIDISLGDIVDYYRAEITCLEGTDIDPDAIKPENYSPNRPPLNTCYIQRWKLGGTRSSNRINKGDSKDLYFLKDNPAGIKRHTNVGYMGDVAIDWNDSDEDGIFGTEGYMRIKYLYPENTPTKYINIPFDTSISADDLPTYVEPTYSDYGTRMYDRMGYGDQKKSLSLFGSYYVSGLAKGSMWGQVLDDPSNAFYNGNYEWHRYATEAPYQSNVFNFAISIRTSRGGGYEGENKYRRIYHYDGIDSWLGPGKSTYLSHLGKGRVISPNEAEVNDIYYYLILNKDYEGYGPLSDDRVISINQTLHDKITLMYTQQYGGAYSFSEGNKFPQDENGYYIPKEYWDEFGFANTNY